MKRTATTVLAAAVILVGLATPAAAGGAPSARGPHAPMPLCVTTPWRAHHTHHALTRPGTVCILTRDMWKPRSWRVLVPWVQVTTYHGEVEVVLARTTRVYR